MVVTRRFTAGLEVEHRLREALTSRTDLQNQASGPIFGIRLSGGGYLGALPLLTVPSRESIGHDSLSFS